MAVTITGVTVTTEEEVKSILAANQNTVLDEAKSAVYSERQAIHGPPSENFQIVAGFWRTYLEGRYDIGVPITDTDVAMMMALFKMGRLTVNQTHRDSQTDACGYVATLEVIQGGSDAGTGSSKRADDSHR
jgi:hypothetical protein